MTTPSITTAPTMASFERPSQWDDEMMAFLEWMQALPAELNALVPFLALAAGPGGVAMVYKFATATSGDPGPGYVRLNNATQAAATAINLDLVDANGIDVSTLLARVATGTSTVKGELKLVKVGDPNTWISFEATSATSPSGYRSVVLQNGVGVPTSSPFAADDQVYAVWSRAGDKGDGAIWSTFASPTLTGSSITLQASIPANSNDLKFEFDAVTSTGGSSAPTISLSANGSSFSTAIQLTSSNVLRATGAVNIRHHRANILVVESALVDATLTSPAGQTASPIFIPHKISGGAIAVRFAWTGGDTFAGGGALTAQSR